MTESSPRIAIIGAGAMGSTIAYLFARARLDVTMIVRNPIRRRDISDEGVWATNRLDPLRRSTKYRVKVVPELVSGFDIVFVIVQSQQMKALVPVLTEHAARTIVLMFNCASGADQWNEQLGESKILWVFPSMLADFKRSARKVEYLVVPRPFEFAQITTIGSGAEGASSTIEEIRELFTKAGVSTAVTHDIDSWLKTHAAMMAPIMAAGYRQPGTVSAMSWETSVIVASAIKQSLTAVDRGGSRISPRNVRLLKVLPVRVLATALCFVFSVPTARRSLGSHSAAGPGEVTVLLQELSVLGKRSGVEIDAVNTLLSQVPSEA